MSNKNSKSRPKHVFPSHCPGDLVTRTEDREIRSASWIVGTGVLHQLFRINSKRNHNKPSVRRIMLRFGFTGDGRVWTWGWGKFFVLFLFLPSHYSKQHMAVCGLSLHQGSTESRKTLEQKFIFQIGTLNPHGINERFSFNFFILLFFTLPCTNQ